MLNAKSKPLCQVRSAAVNCVKPHMTRGLFLIQRLIVIGSVNKSITLLNKMLKRSAHSPPERKSKMNQDALATVKSYSTDQFNLKSDFSQPDIMPEADRVASDDKHYQVEYLETPVKSENDKKQYRLARNNTYERYTYLFFFYSFIMSTVILYDGIIK